MKKLVIVLLILIALVIVLGVLAGLMMGGKGGGKISLGHKVAVVRVEGAIMSSRGVVEEIRDYADDTSIKAIVIRVDSPGGAVAPSQEIFNEVRRAAGKKNVVISMGSMAASGGYYISAPATRILANPGTITGSIGVIMEIPNVEALMDKVGVKSQVIKSGPHKDMASMFREMSEEDREIMQGVINDVYEQFVQDVSSSRKLSLDGVRRLADGRIYTGRQAVEAGLVDELGGFQEAVAKAAELSGIQGEPDLVEHKETGTFLDLIEQKVSTRIGQLAPSFSLKYQFVP